MYSKPSKTSPSAVRRAQYLAAQAAANKAALAAVVKATEAKK